MFLKGNSPSPALLGIITSAPKHSFFVAETGRAVVFSVPLPCGNMPGIWCYNRSQLECFFPATDLRRATLKVHIIQDYSVCGRESLPQNIQCVVVTCVWAYLDQGLQSLELRTPDQGGKRNWPCWERVTYRALELGKIIPLQMMEGFVLIKPPPALWFS